MGRFGSAVRSWRVIVSSIWRCSASATQEEKLRYMPRSAQNAFFALSTSSAGTLIVIFTFRAGSGRAAGRAAGASAGRGAVADIGGISGVAGVVSLCSH